MVPADKTCLSCGRRITWRKKWERDWDEVRYCSTSCRRRGVTEDDRRREAAIAGALRTRNDTVRWTELDEPGRRAARRLAAQGVVELIAAGRRVDPSTAKGDVSVRRHR